MVDNTDRTIPQAAAKIAGIHLDRVITGQDDNSVSTIANGSTASRRWDSRTIEVAVGYFPGSGLIVSEQSHATISSRVTQIE